ncbi:hypothetical protein BD770DRAFT_315986 [Pilaira anomala]|nr:hypothetical protein BD770DRAFT_315986 [Pilaira anomala]
MLVKLGNTAQNLQAHRSIITSLESMMWEKDVGKFGRKLSEFFINTACYPEFLNYFKINYLDGDKYIQWCAAFQPQIYSNMETNNFVESWHNQLKSTYLERKRNIRADRLLYIIANDIGPDFIANTNRIQLNNIGRMGPEERRRRRRELDAESISEEVIPLLMEEVEDDQSNNESIFLVKSFTTNSVEYRISVIEDGMKSCTCPDFTWNSIACKHMYLLRRYKRVITVFVATTSLLSPEVYIAPEAEQQQQETDVQALPKNTIFNGGRCC